MYYLIRFFVRLALRIYCRQIQVNDEPLLKSNGPMILASNHPNSFLDAIVIAASMKDPVHFLAIGEVTDKLPAPRILKALKIIPIYRLQDNRENQERNDKSFSLCVDVLLKNGIVLIFSEGVCENNWKLRPVKKTTARIAIAALASAELSSKLRILPVCLNYNSYDHPGKIVLIQFAEPITYNNLESGTSEADKMHILNELLKERLSGAMLQTENQTGILQVLISNGTHFQFEQLKKLQERMIGSGETNIFTRIKNPGYLISKTHSFSQSLSLIFILAPIAIPGFFLNAVLYYPLKYFVSKKTSRSSYFDSVLFTSLVLLYPPYWVILNMVGCFCFENIWIRIIFLSTPLLAWVTIYWKEKIVRVWNYLILSRRERTLASGYFN